MDERLRFIDDWLRREWTMLELCHLYGISRPFTMNTAPREYQ